MTGNKITTVFFFLVVLCRCTDLSDLKPSITNTNQAGNNITGDPACVNAPACPNDDDNDDTDDDTDGDSMACNTTESDKAAFYRYNSGMEDQSLKLNIKPTNLQVKEGDDLELLFTARDELSAKNDNTSYLFIVQLPSSMIPNLKVAGEQPRVPTITRKETSSVEFSDEALIVNTTNNFNTISAKVSSMGKESCFLLTIPVNGSSGVNPTQFYMYTTIDNTYMNGYGDGSSPTN